MPSLHRIPDRLANVRRRLRYGDRLEARHLEALAVLGQLEPRHRWVTWSGSSMRPAAVKLVVDHVVTYRPTTLVELGAGTSTRLVARAIAVEGLPTRVLSFDAEAGWCDAVRAQLEVDGTSAVATVVHAPLVDLAEPTFPGASRWFDWEVLRVAIEEHVAASRAEGVDMLVVDGPAAWAATDRRNRGEVVAHLAPLLSPVATVIVDDVLRAGERRMLRAWRERAGVDCRLRPLDGVAVARTDGTTWL